MSLLKCPECGHVVSEYAKSCPNCGCPMEQIKILLASSEPVTKEAPVSEPVEEAPKAVLYAPEVQESKAVPFHYRPSENVYDAIILFSKRINYIGTTEHGQETSYYHALRNSEDTPVAREGFEALKDHCYRLAIANLKESKPFEVLRYYPVAVVSGAEARRIYLEYKAYQVMDAIRVSEKAFNENIIDNPDAFLASFVDKNPHDVSEVSSLSGLNSTFIDAEAMVADRLKRFVD